MLQLIPNQKVAKFAMVLIAMVGLINLISAYYTYRKYCLLIEYNPAFNNAIEAIENIESYISIITLLLFVSAAIVFLIWFNNAYKNLKWIIKSIKYNTEWAIGAWFVPILCFIRPYKIMRELFESTQTWIAAKDEKTPVLYNINIINWWWAIWVIGNILSQIVFRIGLTANTIPELSSYTQFSLLSTLLDIPMAIFAILVIRSYAKMEKMVSSF